jgi:hypothetical protein
VRHYVKRGDKDRGRQGLCTCHIGFQMAEGYPQDGRQALFGSNGLKRTLQRARVDGVPERRHVEKILLNKFATKKRHEPS